MKSLILFLSLLLTMAIVMPSIITLAALDNDSTAILDFTEEERNKQDKNENKNPVDEKDFFLYSRPNTFTALRYKTSYFKGICAKKDYTYALEIFLPPPKIINCFFQVLILID